MDEQVRRGASILDKKKFNWVPEGLWEQDTKYLPPADAAYIVQQG